MHATKCPVCSIEVEQSPKGRSAIYCGPVCKQLVQHETRRLLRRIERLEDAQLELTQLDARGKGLPDIYDRTPSEQLEDITDALSQAQTRLRELLESVEA